MIEVTVTETGDRAEAASPEEAVFAALTIAREAKAHRGIHGFDPTLVFRVAGKIVRTTSLRALTRTA